ncbi:hypothetical protein QR680_009197 [Steinernema hermaphroditum]|uniref:PIPK domain-containing protein n=1 Tax=Steinernema hermaphroditum TaxID=289476 RepID=A0AA39M8Z6_9BILA|nr:hypothetical protein QR680_009197 [Steinernema hermaphroditum]
MSSPKNSESLRADEIREKQKLGHRRIDRQGEVSYKRVPTNALMGAIQLGIANSIGSLASKPERQLLVQDFGYVVDVAFPSEGSLTTPSHQYGDFRFKTYAPMAFRHFRDLFNIKPADFLRSICTEPLKELSNPGASGSIFYVSSDDQFIIKTVQKKEAEFFQRLLSGYYMNIHQNPKTLLPKFFGFFCYQSFGKNIRLLVMNNLFPQTIAIHEKYDLKGSTYKRMASKAEREKNAPTLKDLDFLKDHKDGIMLDPVAYDALVNVLGRDTLVLRCFRIMDYSMLVGVHNLNIANEAGTGNTTEEEGGEQPGTSRAVDVRHKRSQRLKSKFSMWGPLQGDDGFSNNPADGIPARNTRGENLLLFIGIIDILQSYRISKKIEHIWKSVVHDGDTVSVHHPDFYAERFQNFIQNQVFKKLPRSSQRQSDQLPSCNRRRHSANVANAARKELLVDLIDANDSSRRCIWDRHQLIDQRIKERHIMNHHLREEEEEDQEVESDELDSDPMLCLDRDTTC